MPPNAPDGRRGRPLEQESPPTDPTAASVTPSADSAPAADIWRRDAATALNTLARSGVQFTADDVLKLVGAPATTGRQISSAFGLAQRRHLIVSVGATIGHGGRLLRVWRGVPT
jgi:hypothetical protein